jgi:RHO1 GDP-GTP exchange protein 1/2
LEYLSLASFNDEPEDRHLHIGFFKRIGSCIPYAHISTGPTKKQMNPFTIYHVAAKITRRHTIYTETKTERNKWKAELEKAIESRKSQQDVQMVPLLHF